MGYFDFNRGIENADNIERPRAADNSELKAYLRLLAERRGLYIPSDATFSPSGVQDAGGNYIVETPGYGRQPLATCEIMDDDGNVLRTIQLPTNRKGAIAMDAKEVQAATGLQPVKKARKAPAAPKVAKATATRANRALAMLCGTMRGMGTRKLDDCFEQGDGDAVAAQMIARIRDDAELARAVMNGTSVVVDQGDRIDVYATRFMSSAMMAAALDSMGAETPRNRFRTETADAIDALRTNAPVQAPEQPAHAPAAPIVTETPAPIAQAPEEAPMTVSTPSADVAVLVATVAALVQRVTTLERAASGEIVRDRSAARLNTIRAYLRMRAMRNAAHDLADLMAEQASAAERQLVETRAALAIAEEGRRVAEQEAQRANALARAAGAELLRLKAARSRTARRVLHARAALSVERQATRDERAMGDTARNELGQVSADLARLAPLASALQGLMAAAPVTPAPARPSLVTATGLPLR